MQPAEKFETLASIEPFKEDAVHRGEIDGRFIWHAR
jgi:hypothetical protein